MKRSHSSVGPGVAACGHVERGEARRVGCPAVRGLPRECVRERRVLLHVPCHLDADPARRAHRPRRPDPRHEPAPDVRRAGCDVEGARREAAGVEVVCGRGAAPRVGGCRDRRRAQVERHCDLRPGRRAARCRPARPVPAAEPVRRRCCGGRRRPPDDVEDRLAVGERERVRAPLGVAARGVPLEDVGLHEHVAPVGGHPAARPRGTASRQTSSPGPPVARQNPKGSSSRAASVSSPVVMAVTAAALARR